MKPVSKVILISLIVLVALVGAGLVGASIYIRGDGARAQLEDTLSKAVKTPVKIGRISASGRSLRAEGIAAASPDGHATPLIAAESLRANFRLTPLLSGELHLHDIVLEKAHLAWAQNAEGKWVWPSRKKSDDGEPKEDKPKTEEAKAEKRKDSVLFEGVDLRNSTVELLDEERKPVVVAKGVNASLSEIGKESVAGLLKAESIQWDKYEFTEVQTPFKYTPGSVLLDSLTSQVLGGEASGRLELDTKTEGTPFKARVDLKAVDLAKGSKIAGLEEGEMLGKLSGTADVEGRMDKLARFEGPASLSIERGHFRKLELFDSVGHILDLPELSNMQPREAKAEIEFRDEKAFVKSMAIATDNLRITANGVARFDTKLILEAHLTVSESLAKSMRDANLGNFKRLDDGTYGVDFKITGNTNKPKTDLAEKVIGGKVKDKVGDLLGDLFGTKKDKDKEKKEKKDKDKDDKKEKDKDEDGEKKDEKVSEVAAP